MFDAPKHKLLTSYSPLKLLAEFNVIRRCYFVFVAFDAPIDEEVRIGLRRRLVFTDEANVTNHSKRRFRPDVISAEEIRGQCSSGYRLRVNMI